MNALIKTLLVLTAIGAINWGLVGFFEWNLVQAIFAGNGAEEANTIERVIYSIIGLSGLATLLAIPRVHAPEIRARGHATA